MISSKDKLQFSRFFRNSSKFHAPPVNMHMFNSMEIKQWEYEYSRIFLICLTDVQNERGNEFPLTMCSDFIVFHSYYSFMCYCMKTCISGL